MAHWFAMNAFLTLALAWVGSLIVAQLVGGLALRIKPDLRFSTQAQVDGLGYVHQPFDVVVNLTLIAGLNLGALLFLK